MKIRSRHFVGAIVATTLCSEPGVVAAERFEQGTPVLRITSSTPMVDIKPRGSHYRELRLPSLEYVFRIESNCTSGRGLQSVLLSIADTRERISALDLELAIDSGIKIKVPSGQISPLSMENFCVDDENSTSIPEQTVTVRGALSAQAALLCENENEEKVTYASLSLNVTLHCASGISDSEN